VWIQTVVQHDPRRAHLLPSLLPRLPKGATVVHDPGASDPQRSPWRCYRACLQTFSPAATHLLIVQDDVLVCRDFPDALAAVIAARPDVPVALFVPGVMPNSRRVLDACWAGDRWAELDVLTWAPVVAVVWPRGHVGRLLEFAAAKDYPPSRFGDDSIVGDYAREQAVTIWATVPSLVEHPDTEASLVGTVAMGGANPQRVAACWLGEETHWTEIFG
jgi:hypothetical protein